MDGTRRFYYINANLKSEITFKEGKAVKGFIYAKDGQKTQLTNAHFHKMKLNY